MAIYQKSVSISGGWAKGSEIKSGSKAKITGETVQRPSSFLNKDGSTKIQDITKIKIQGQPEELNCNLNRATINALIDAYGEDSNNWIDKVVTIETEKVRVAGKSVTALYLVPEGFIRTDDENGYAVIVKEGEEISNEINEDQVPF